MINKRTDAWKTGVNLLTLHVVTYQLWYHIVFTTVVQLARQIEDLWKALKSRAQRMTRSCTMQLVHLNFERKCFIYKTGSTWISVISLLESILAMVEQNVQDHTMTITTCRESKVKIYKMSTNFWNNYTPCSLDNVEAFACGLEGFRLGATFGFRVAIILSSLWQGRPLASSAPEFQ